MEKNGHLAFRLRSNSLFYAALIFLGHYLDQKRLKMGLYRHPWDDITYLMPDHLQHLRPASFE